MNKLKIRELREARGMSQRQLANEVGVSPGAVAQWELGATTPTTANLVALANVLGCSMDTLFGRVGQEQTSA